MQLYFNRNLNQGILSPVWQTYGLGVILDTKQLQKTECKWGLIPFKPTKEQETILHFWKTSHSFSMLNKDTEVLGWKVKTCLVFLPVTISSGAQESNLPA